MASASSAAEPLTLQPTPKELESLVLPYWRPSVLCDGSLELFSGPAHTDEFLNPDRASEESEGVRSWKTKDRVKTAAVALCVCLNIGVDPPDIVKPSPCARLECWIDPVQFTATKALESIGKRLQDQYERWQPKAKYRVSLDPTVDEVKKLCHGMRRIAKDDRVLFHYNGHGVPRPTPNGELWVFNKTFTQYIPLSIYDLYNWLGSPSVYVFDCSSAGLVVSTFIKLLQQRQAMDSAIVFASCLSNETLPQTPSYPADLFTSCITTPLKTALRWFCSRNVLIQMHPDLYEKIPGKLNDRKTLLGELNWIFTAVTDTIAWTSLPREQFRRLFRQDLMVASIFRNFLLADRIMRTAGCTPISLPSLPPTHRHSLWAAWDLAADFCMSQVAHAVPPEEMSFSSFFTEQLTAFEVWLDFASEDKGVPEQLPIVLQVLLSTNHRHRALALLARFVDLGSWAVLQSLSVGVFPYVLKLTTTPNPCCDLQPMLVFMWSKILAVDRSVQVDFVKDGGHNYLLQFLCHTPSMPELKVMALYSLCRLTDEYLEGQQVVGRAFFPMFHHLVAETNVLYCQWLCLTVARLCRHAPDVQALGQSRSVINYILNQSDHCCPLVRASALSAAAALLVPLAPTGNNIPEPVIQLLPMLRCCSYDGSHIVRLELVSILSNIVALAMTIMTSCAGNIIRPLTVRLSMDAGLSVSGAMQQPLTVIDLHNSVPFSEIDAKFGLLYRSKAELIQEPPSLGVNDPALCVFGMVTTLSCDPCHGVATRATTIIRTLQNKLGCPLTPLPEVVVSAVKFDPTYVELLGIFSGGARGGGKDSRDKGKLSGKRSQVPETQKKGMFGGFLSPISSPKNAPGDAAFEVVSVLSLEGTDIDDILYLNAKRSLGVSVLECSIPLEDRQVIVDSKSHDAITAGLRASSELSLEPAPKMDSQICVLDLENQAPVFMLFHPYQPLLVVADAACSVTLWMPDRGIMRCEFSNCSPVRASISAMSLTSASSSTGGHLLVGTDDGYVRVWGDLFSVKSNKVRLASSFLALPGCKGKGAMLQHEPFYVAN
jgi:hypothetical protein